MKALKVLGLSLMMLVGVAEAKIANQVNMPRFNVNAEKQFALTKNNNTFSFALSDERDLHKMSYADLKKEQAKLTKYVESNRIENFKLSDVSQSKFYFTNNINSEIPVYDMDSQMYHAIKPVYERAVGVMYRAVLTNLLVGTKEEKRKPTFDEIEDAKARAAKYALVMSFASFNKTYHAELCALGYNYGVLETQLCSDNYVLTMNKVDELTSTRYEEGFYNNLNTQYGVKSLKYRHYTPMSHDDQVAKYIVGNLTEKTFTPFLKNGISSEYTYKNGKWVLKKFQNQNAAVKNAKTTKNNG